MNFKIIIDLDVDSPEDILNIISDLKDDLESMDCVNKVNPIKIIPEIKM